jgi:ubiquinone/menaquinone biosynthesis C-methylase UbiE
MDKVTIDTYDKMAEEYDEETSTFWKRFPVNFIEQFVKDLKQGKVLDAGSGPGRDGLILKSHGLNVLCMDASQKMVDICISKGLDSIKGDLLDLPSEDNSFDGVWAYTSLLHLKKETINKAIAEIKRVLKKEGLFALGMIEGEGEFYRESSGMNLPRWFAFYTKKELENLLITNNFEITHFQEFQVGRFNYLNYILKNDK